MLVKMRHMTIFLAVTATIILAVLTHIPSYYFPDEIEYNDKFVHFIAYAIVSFLYGLSFSARSWRTVAYSLALILLLAALAYIDEYTQPFFGREYSIFDYYADLKGIVLGVVLSKVIRLIYYISTGKFKLTLSK